MNATALLSRIRDADWFDQARASGYARVMVVIAGLALAGLIALSPSGVDPRGEPLGTDFSSFWAASKLALSGAPTRVYDVAAHYAVQRQAFGPQTGYYAFFYPPIWLMLCLPLAMLPYLASLGLCLLATGAAYVAVIRRYAEGALGVVPILAFPAVFLTIGHGQNSFLTAALFGAGALMMDRRPLLAGLLFGCLAFKPHLAVLLPVALAASGRWRVFFATGATAVALGLASLALFGLDTWKAFLAAAPLATKALEDNLVGAEKMQSLYAAVRLLGGSSHLAYAFQLALALCVVLALVLLLRRKIPADAHGPAMAAATLLASPFLLDYDLTLLAIPLAWIFARALRTGFLPYEKFILLVAFALPAFSRVLAGAVHIPLAPLVIGLVFWCVARRGLLQTAPQADLRIAPAGEAA